MTSGLRGVGAAGDGIGEFTGRQDEAIHGQQHDEYDIPSLVVWLSSN